MASPAGATFPGGHNGKVAYAAVNSAGFSAIWAVNPTGSGRTQLTHPAGGASDTAPRWSADGTRLTFTRVGGPNGSAVWTMATNGTHQTIVVVGSHPTWSPDGQWIAFIGNITHGPAGALFKIRSTPPYGAPILLNNPGTSVVDSEPDWSPDGTTISFARTSSASSRIYTLNPTTGHLSDLINPPDACSDLGAVYNSATIGPLGQNMVFACDNYGARQPATIYKMSVMGSTPIFVTPGWDPSWSPVDGHQIVYTNVNTPSEAGYKVMVANADGSSIRTLVAHGFDPDWQPLP